MKQRAIPLWGQLTALLVMVLVLVWSVAFYELYRSRQTALHDAELETLKNAQIFAEYSRSTLKRVNEFILDARRQWTGDWQSFAGVVTRAQENIDDISFQVAIIDRDGIMQFSNLAKPSDRVDLSTREHFSVHREAGGRDQLFVSRPLLGKVSGKWSIQVTRPLIRNGEFAGVIVVSLSPDQFASFAKKLNMGKGNVMTVVRSTGEIMARYPGAETSLGNVLKDRPFQATDAPLSANYRQVSVTDGVDRIWGYIRLPEYGVIFVVGNAIDDVLASYHENRTLVLSGATSVSLLAAVLLFMLYRSLSAVDEARGRLSEIFALSPDGFVSFDRNRRVAYASPAFLRMSGLVSAQVAGLDEDAFSERLASLCTPSSRFAGFALLRKGQVVESADSAAPGQSDSVRQAIEIASPPSRILEISLRLSNAATVSQILYFRDVTHETEVDRMKSEFLSTAAHELRTPMASIYGFAELLTQQEFDETTRRELIGTIHQQSALMSSIINELLDLARIEARRGLDFVLEPASLPELVGEALARYKLPDGRATPEIEAADQDLPIRVDRQKIQQAVTNLISNAYKYSPEGSPVAIRYLRANEDGNTMIGVEVSDRGIGMTVEQTARVFERFYRADSSGKVPGTGLGMSIVKEIVGLHHGRVELDSRPGHGTRVTIWLPASA
jgi:signal transduction histidine kinase